ncbi:hypothetical protein HN51_003118 [Arachis hypogaea]|uniref:UspA domain-containing protein n=1 Tax=Arachis hypogaea TaxID=3818 RepID=A0A445EK08_ARAHY|nr:uncharacterized protein LOC112708878 isoform X1 [Arachis hypogaea]XP_057726977.1 uncharacterized protein LOC130942282 isoform X2 [Arachis stenosperma]QHO51443.1 uncharacterized protein DS421_1g30970 [Arachis hypogaea]RYR75736.1 hypothetical protein Ahy_A01g000315 [Arachis hypogaea]
MDVRKVVVVVEEVEAARTALQWALHNIIRYGDIITLLHLYPFTSSKSKSKSRLLRLKGFHLALSFQDICNKFSNTKVEIVVTQENKEGMKIVGTVRDIGASMLVVGLHDQSFLYKLAMGHNNISRYFNCRVIAINQPPIMSPHTHQSSMVSSLGVLDSSANMDFSLIHISGLQVPDTPPPKVKYQICPDPTAIIWRLKKSRRR